MAFRITIQSTDVGDIIYHCARKNKRFAEFSPKTPKNPDFRGREAALRGTIVVNSRSKKSMMHIKTICLTNGKGCGIMRP